MEASSDMCRHCRARPRFGSYPYCGRTCAGAAKIKSQSAGNSPPAGATPQNPFISFMAHPLSAPTVQVSSASPATPSPPVGQRPRHSPRPSASSLPSVIDGISSPNLSPSPPAASGARLRHSPQPSASSLPSVTDGMASLSLGLSSSPPSVNGASSPAAITDSFMCLPSSKVTCRIPECDEPPFQFGAEYCSNQHRAEAVRRGLVPPCISCYVYPRALYYYCGQNCNDRVSNGGPSLLPLEDRDPKFEEIRHLFDASWKYTTRPQPKVKSVHKIVLGKGGMSRFFAYRKQVEESRTFISQCKTPGNEGRRWFGTHRACQLGDNPNWMMHCHDPQCGLCPILKKSFRKGPPGRFGAGIYSSALSSRADDFSSNQSSLGALKAAILATVVIGRGLKCLSERPDLTAPPSGYDSILTETGTSMAFDEVVVYSEDAIRPIWLVIYDPNPSG